MPGNQTIGEAEATCRKCHREITGEVKRHRIVLTLCKSCGEDSYKGNFTNRTGYNYGQITLTTGRLSLCSDLRRCKKCGAVMQPYIAKSSSKTYAACPSYAQYPAIRGHQIITTP